MLLERYKLPEAAPALTFWHHASINLIKALRGIPSLIQSGATDKLVIIASISSAIRVLDPVFHHREYLGAHPPT